MQKKYFDVTKYGRSLVTVRHYFVTFLNIISLKQNVISLFRRKVSGIFSSRNSGSLYKMTLAYLKKKIEKEIRFMEIPYLDMK